MSTQVLSRLSGAAREAWQILRGVMGENAYERYLAHHRTHHPGEQPQTEREFWRSYIDRQDAVPGSRCC